MTTHVTNIQDVFTALRGFGRRRSSEERCELCSAAISREHPHLLQRSTRQILCACDPCAILFGHRDQMDDLIRIPRDTRKLTDFEIGDVEWNSLHLPIELAFFLRRPNTERVTAYYPSPAGGTESLLPLDSWREIAAGNAVIESMQPDVEALLVDRTRGRRRYYLAPIDQCYKLTGIIRKEWRGFSGGDSVWLAVDQFFEALEASARA